MSISSIQVAVIGDIFKGSHSSTLNNVTCASHPEVFDKSITKRCFTSSHEENLL